MDIVNLAYILLGLLIGVIFVVDGWRKSVEPGAAIHESPRLRGLLYILGGGVIPGIHTLSQNADYLAVYTLSFLGATLILLGGVFVVAFFIAQDRIRQYQSLVRFSSRLSEGFPYAWVALSDGFTGFMAKLEALELVIIQDQRDEVIDFFTGMVSALSERVRAGNVSIESLRDFYERFLEAFLVNIFEDSPRLQNYRGSIHVSTGAGELVYFAGVGPVTNPISQRPLSYEESLAGYAVRNPRMVHQYSRDSDTDVPHQDRGGTNYDTVLSCAIHNLASNVEPALTLSIDCAHTMLPDLKGFSIPVVYALAAHFEHVQTVSGLSNDEIASYALDLTQRRGDSSGNFYGNGSDATSEGAQVT